jgi:DnaK suppressor protein
MSGNLDLNYYKNLLLEKKRKLLRNLLEEKKISEKVGDEWLEPKDIEDFAHVTYDEISRYVLAEHELGIIKEIDIALKKIETGEYGICERCGAEIDPMRLKVIPWTKYCAKCAREIGGE